jgi:Cdc6-like AAA superfamily ATPase
VGFKYVNFKILLKIIDKKMIGKSKINNDFVGPRALFDPNYVPPKLLYRKKEERTLFSILKDSIADDFSLNILYQGIQGIGKKVIINKVLKDLFIGDKEELPFQKICIDCKEKSIEELIFTLLVEMDKFVNLNFNLNSFLNSKMSHLWNTLKLVCRKVNSNLFLIFNNVENLQPEEFKKFLNLGKETNTTIISTVNKILRASTIDFLSYFDLKKKLNYFSYNELNYILKQRVSLTFLKEIDSELIEFISDLICENYVPVPGKGIEILRELYPFLNNQKNIKHYKILEICQIQFDSFQISDEFGMLTYISEEELLMILFLDNLSNHFLSKSNYYITSNELKEVYDISCESLEYEKKLDVFFSIIKKTQRIGILSSSRKSLNDKKNIFNNSLNSESFFMIINPNQLKTIVDTVFGKI